MAQNSIAETLFSDYYRDADALVEGGVATPTDIDTAMRLGAGYPVGPFAARGGLAQGAESAAFDEEVSGWESIAVLGTGHMARGIAEAFARAGKAVRMIGRTAESLERARSSITASLTRAVARGRLTEDAAAAVIERLDYSIDLAEIAGSDLVVEAVAEDLAVKRRVLADAHAAIGPGAAFATNTSSFRVAEVMADLPPERTTLAIHFFNPAVAMKLVEIVPGPSTADVSSQAAALVRELGKTPVHSADTRGFIVNRLLIPYLNDAVRLHEAGVPVRTIDTAMTADAGLPMGPFALIDLIGLDVTVAALESMAESSPDPRLRPADTLYRLIDQGRLGRKSGAGFYQEGDQQ